MKLWNLGASIIACFTRTSSSVFSTSVLVLSLGLMPITLPLLKIASMVHRHGASVEKCSQTSTGEASKTPSVSIDLQTSPAIWCTKPLHLLVLSRPEPLEVHKLPKKTTRVQQCYILCTHVYVHYLDDLNSG